MLYDNSYIVEFTDGTAVLVPSYKLSENVVGSTEYTVVEGDTIYSIANKLFGNTHTWSDIVLLNPEVDYLELEVGQILLVPIYG